MSGACGTCSLFPELDHLPRAVRFPVEFPCADGPPRKPRESDPLVFRQSVASSRCGRHTTTAHWLFLRVLDRVSRQVRTTRRCSDAPRRCRWRRAFVVSIAWPSSRAGFSGSLVVGDSMRPRLMSRRVTKGRGFVGGSERMACARRAALWSPSGPREGERRTCRRNQDTTRAEIRSYEPVQMTRCGRKLWRATGWRPPGCLPRGEQRPRLALTCGVHVPQRSGSPDADPCSTLRRAVP